VRAALVCGINYPGSSYTLRGCVTDANNWAAALGSQGFQVTLLRDAQASRENILGGLKAMVDEAVQSETDGQPAKIVLVYSGHGTQVVDRDGDEVNGQDEALCAWDGRRIQTITDDELYEVFQYADERGVRSLIVADSCFSGTIQRLAPPLLTLVARDGSYGHRAVRWLSPSEHTDLPEQALEASGDKLLTSQGKRDRSAVALTACTETQTADEGFIDGRYQGAFSYAALKALGDLFATYEPQPVNYRMWLRQIRQYLPSQDYGQVPELHGETEQRRWLVLSEAGRR
jgi:hypothetical protein